MHRFKTWLAEEHDSSKPHHIYMTKSGHEIHVHVHKDEHGNTAHFHNKTLGGMVTKQVNWPAGAEAPTKDELEKLSADDEEESEDNLHEHRIHGFLELYEAKLSPEEKAQRAAEKEAEKQNKAAAKAKKAAEKAAAAEEKKKMANVDADGKLSVNGGGIVTEMSTHYWLNEHKHKMAGTYGSPQHKEEQDQIKAGIEQMGKHPHATDDTREQIQLRMYHGRQAAADIIRKVRELHGPKARVKEVGWTSKPGDIPKFTRGHHNDGQENTSDVAVEVADSHHKKTANSDGTHFEGFSLKSSLTKQEVTAKNSGANMDGDFDSPTRKMDASLGAKLLDKHVHKPNGTVGMTTGEREAKLNAARAAHKKAGGKKGESPYELASNEGGRKAIIGMNKHFHDHINGLAADGDHKIIGNAIVKHLYPDTDMRNHKTKVFGDKKEKIRSVTEPNSDHPLKKILRDPKTKFHATLNEGGGAVHIHMTHPDINNGEPVHVYTTGSKSKSNASKSSNLVWNAKVPTLK